MTETESSIKQDRDLNRVAEWSGDWFGGWHYWGGITAWEGRNFLSAELIRIWWAAEEMMNMNCGLRQQPLSVADDINRDPASDGEPEINWTTFIQLFIPPLK